MYETQLEVAMERRKEMEREAKNERLARSVQKDEKPNLLRNVLNVFNKQDEKNQA
jgi:glycine cleavage system regulatory protein